MFKVNSKTLERRHDIGLVSLTYFTPFPYLFIVEFEQINVCWVWRVNKHNHFQVLFAYALLPPQTFQMNIQNSLLSNAKIQGFFSSTKSR